MKTNKTLKILNSVEAKPSNKQPYIDPCGLVIMPEALWAKDDIISHYKSKELTPAQLNKTFHKSWKMIEESSRFELFMHQILHYASTYGTDFMGETYIPLEELEIPEKMINVFVVQGLSRNEIKTRILKTLQSGVAMEQTDLEDSIEVLDTMGHKFSYGDKIRNKEAVILLADKYNLYPEDPTEFLRYCVYKSTDKTLLIKNSDTYAAIKASTFDPTYNFRTFGVEKLAEIFNRFKPIFLAYKSKCPSLINKISALSKSLHTPMKQSELNFVTSQYITGDISGATIFALLRAWSIIKEAKVGHEDGRVFFIRNGKSFVKDEPKYYDAKILASNESVIIKTIKAKIEAKSVYLPENIDYALPVSAKMFVGNIPMGTKFFGKNLGVGVYWENSWGANDIDLSGLTSSGKVGWDASYNQGRRTLMYSGDITNAPNGAVEYLYSDGRSFSPTIVMSNIYSGNDDCGYSIVVGESPDKDRKLMMDANKTLAHIKTSSVQKQTVLGLIFEYEGKQAFSIVNVGAGTARVSGGGEYTTTARNVFIKKWQNCLTLKEALLELGFIITKQEDCDVDLSLDKVTKETFINLFN